MIGHGTPPAGGTFVSIFMGICAAGITPGLLKSLKIQADPVARRTLKEIHSCRVIREIPGTTAEHCIRFPAAETPSLFAVGPRFSQA